MNYSFNSNFKGTLLFPFIVNAITVKAKIRKIKVFLRHNKNLTLQKILEMQEDG